MARELIILPRLRRDYRTARKHPEFDAETLEYVFDLMIAGDNLQLFGRQAKKAAAKPALTQALTGTG